MQLRNSLGKRFRGRFTSGRIMQRFEKILVSISGKCNRIAALAIVLMMLITSLDVMLRLFGSPIPGVYEIVGLLGSLAIAFALAYTSIEKGHIAVEVLVQRLPQRVQSGITILYSAVACLFFLLSSWVCVDFAMELYQSGEVSLTIKMPTYPFVVGIGLGCMLLSLVLFVDFARSLRELQKK